jgi:hypothetical protein
VSGLVVRRYVASVDEALRCSQCEQIGDVLAKLPLTGFLRGWRRLVPTPEDPWIGLCEGCVRALLEGFGPARAQAEEDTKK